MPQLSLRNLAYWAVVDRPVLFLYDVTSSYLEGEHNALGAFSYNRGSPTPEFIKRLADHIAEFSLMGMQAVGREDLDREGRDGK